MSRLADWCRLLSDDTRLRLLRLVRRERLNVSELTGILGVAQSGVSRHLGLLKEAGLVTESREGGFVYYAVTEPNGDSTRQLWALLDSEFAGAPPDSLVQADDARLQEVLRVRKESFRREGDVSRQLVPGRSWAAWARALGHLLPGWTLVDVGCGEGYLTLEAARWAREVIAIDRSAAMLQRARALAKRRAITNVTWKRGEMEEVPLATGTADVTLLSQALHHATDPAVALREANRVTKEGGHVLVLDLRRHDQGWVKRLGDKWLGFEDEELRALMVEAGLERVTVQVGAKLRGDPFTVLVASGVKPHDLRRPSNPSRPLSARRPSTPLGATLSEVEGSKGRDRSAAAGSRPLVARKQR